MAHHIHKGFNPEMAEEERHKMTSAERAALKRAHEARDKKMRRASKPDGISVLPVKDGYAESKLDHWLFPLPFRAALAGPSESSGETTWLLNMLVLLRPAAVDRQGHLHYQRHRPGRQEGGDATAAAGYPRRQQCFQLLVGHPGEDLQTRAGAPQHRQEGT
jgi:hypothetical protein